MQRIVLLTLIASALTIGFSVNAQTDPGTENLTHKWTFDDGTATDEVGGANGTLSGNAIICGQSLNTISGGYLELPAATIAINTYPEVSLVTWFTSDGGSNDGYEMLTYFGEADYAGWLGVDYLFNSPANGPNNRTAISCLTYENPWDGENGVNHSGGPIDDGELHQLITVVDDTAIYYYLDGTLAGSDNLTGNNSIANLSNSSAYLCKSGYINDPTWNGLVHKFSMYDKALSAGEALFLYQEGPEENPVQTVELSASLSVNGNAVEEANCAQTMTGGSVDFMVEIVDPTGSTGFVWQWKGPNGFTAQTQDISLNSLQTNQSGTYSAMLLDDCGFVNSVQHFHLTVFEQENGTRYFWPEYSPTVAFTPENPNLPMPTQNLPDCPGEDYNLDWWTFKKGPEANSLVTDAAIQEMLEYFNQEFNYFTNEMGWPRDKRAQEGYRSGIYLFGSGLCTDEADSTALGGWMGATWYNEESWPMVLASYFPVYCSDPACPWPEAAWQRDAMIHEGIHSILASMDGCKDAGWFHEGGNTWLQQEAAARRSGDYSTMGFLNAGAFIAPFMPIECYSGWLQDESFGGPSAEGVNMFNGTQQICTWKNLLGGTQYGNTFPVYLAQTLGDKSIPWIWNYCESRVLEGLADSIGEQQTRRLISEYRAKQALLSFGKWSEAIRGLVNEYFNIPIGPEWEPYWLPSPVWQSTPYVRVEMDTAGWYVPEYRTTPGWSGGNQIPLHVEGDTAIIDFQPLGNNMTCQLCYRTATGETVYGQPVFGGECMINLDKGPAAGIVFVVVTNTNYIYEGEQTRKAHYDYRIKPMKNITGKADELTTWFNNFPLVAAVKEVPYDKGNISVNIFPNPVNSNEKIKVEFNDPLKRNTTIEIIDTSGQLLYQQNVTNSIIEVPCNFETGLYLIKLRNESDSQTYKFIIH